tara:strand:- start:4133 stop:4486 length:354 start_codon:yes stop_codon:yes gene_type:complete
MNKINIVNKSNHAPTDRDFYVGRGSAFGNPFTSRKISETKAEFQASSREEAIEKYDNYLEMQLKLKQRNVIKGIDEMVEMLKEGDINLVCYCAPKKCHAEVIKNKVLAMTIQYLMPE